MTSEDGKIKIKKDPLPFSVVLGVCMDDAIKVGSGVLTMGMAGTGVTSEMPTARFSQENIDLVNRVRQYAFRGIRKIAQTLGVAFEATSHPGCGWATAQAISEESLPAATESMARSEHVPYRGHINVADKPVNMGQDNISACITRDPAMHHHNADGIILTTGGFITQEEKDRLDRDGFVISADWVDEAVAKGLTLEDAHDFINLQVKVARGIMHGKDLAIKIFDAGRISQPHPLAGMVAENL